MDAASQAEHDSTPPRLAARPRDLSNDDVRYGMTKMSDKKNVLCIDSDVGKLRLEALMQRCGIQINLKTACSKPTIDKTFGSPGYWDLILCDTANFFDLEIEEYLRDVSDRLDASLILIKPKDSNLSPSEGYGWGSADVVLRGDANHLMMVCERELKNVEARKALRELKAAALSAAKQITPPQSNSAQSIVVAKLTDISSTETVQEEPQQTSEPDTDLIRIKSLISTGGLRFEFQPIVPLQEKAEQEALFEVLVRLKDESDNLIPPRNFLPRLSQSGHMNQVDIAIYRRILSKIESLQKSRKHNTKTKLFVNLAINTACSSEHIKTLCRLTSVSRIDPGSIVVELHRDAFIKAPEQIAQLRKTFESQGHGILVENAELGDCKLLKLYKDTITHIKLGPNALSGLTASPIIQEQLSSFIKCAHSLQIQVIALAVERADVLPALFKAGVDLIQGYFVSNSHDKLIYPSIQRILSET